MNQAKVTLDVRKGNQFTSIIDIQGEITAFAESALTEAFTRASADGTRVIILNFNGLEYMNSSGIGLLVMLLIRANRQGQQLMAIGLSDHYKQIFDLTRLNEAIRIFDDEETALASYTP